MIFEKIRIVNIGSFAEEEFIFPQHPFLVQGINSTDRGQGSSGSGKSWIQDSLLLALAAINGRKENLKGVIRRGQKLGEVELDVYCPMREQRLNIYRLFKKSGTALEIKINDVKQEISTVDDGNKFILDWLDMTKEDIINYYIISPDKYKTFFVSSNKEKLDLILRLADAKFVDNVDPYIKEDIEDLEAVIKEVGEDISKYEGRIDECKTQISSLSSVDSEKAKQEAIDEIKKNIKDKSSERNDLLVKKSKFIVDKDNLETEINDVKLKLKKAKDELPDITETKTSLRDVQSDILETNSLIMEARKNIQGSVSCPSCSFEFVAGKTDIDIELEKQVIEDCELVLVDFREEEKALKEAVSDYRKKVESVELIEKELEDNKKEFRRAERAIESIESDVSDIQEDIESANNRIKFLENKAVTDGSEMIESLNKNIEKYKAEILELKADKQDVENELFEVNQWTTNFVRFKMHISNSIIKDIQVRCNLVLDKMNSDLRVMIDGFKILGDGKMKEEIGITVVRDEPASFYSYSNGEKGRVQVAMIIATQELLNSKNKYGGLKFLAMDERPEGLDAEGLSFIMKSLKDFYNTIMITTHVSDRNTYGKKVVVEKVNKISRILK
jgi:DNA repair exonuclease SbcCD ATPase subunit